MAYITLNSDKLKHNYNFLDKLLRAHNIQWAVVSKLLCGHELYLGELIKLGAQQLCDSRASNLKSIKAIDPNVETIYIKPPPKHSIDEIVAFADISFNTEIETIELLSAEAKTQNKVHKIIIMIEMGELREGVLRDDLLSFYERVFKLPNIEVIGLGTNLTCMYGVLPSHDKLIQLCLYEQLIEAKFNREIPFVSGGSSVTLPLINQNLLPRGINHFRIGESLFLGNDVYNNGVLEGMEGNVFQLFAEIIELTEKPKVPMGDLGANMTGEVMDFQDQAQNDHSFRAIIDLGLLDIDQDHIQLKNKDLKVVGASSDMLVVDLGENESGLQVGDVLEFSLDYMGILRVMNSKYIEKRVN